ncbi:MAG: flagellar hook-basal body complex protein FliE [Acidobacteriota bacterium]
MSNISLGGIQGAYAPQPASLDIGAGNGGGGNFTDVLKSAVDGVNQANDSAASQVTNLLQGGGSDLNSVMVAVEKADVSFQLMMQVRNKIVSAYQDIEKMQF